MSKLQTKRRRLFFDIETSANIGYFWQCGYKLNIGPENIIKERAIICICYKWEDEKEVYSLQWDSKQSDKKLLQSFIEVANQATEIVGHNGDRFDLPWVRSRCFFHRLEMFPKYVTIDTLKIARSQFRFNSNKLDYLGRFAGLGGKIHTDFNLWKDVMNGSKTAMEKMIKYCKKDVILLEKVYDVFRNHIAPKSHFGVIFGADRGSCPECGSDDIVVNMRRTTARGVKQIQYRCNTCNKIHSKTDK